MALGVGVPLAFLAVFFAWPVLAIVVCDEEPRWMTWRPVVTVQSSDRTSQNAKARDPSSTSMRVDSPGSSATLRNARSSFAGRVGPPAGDST